MKTMHGWRGLAMAIACGTLAACGGGSGQDISGSAAFNAPPVLTGAPPTQAKVGEEYLFDPVASDPDGDVLTFRIENRPTWATFSPTTGRLRGTPGPDVLPNYPDIEISVTSAPRVNITPGRYTRRDIQPTRLSLMLISGRHLSNRLKLTIMMPIPARNTAQSGR